MLNVMREGLTLDICGASKKGLKPKNLNCPSAMLDIHGRLVTTETDLKNVAMDHYKKVLENRPVLEGLQDYQEEREALCKDRIQEAGRNTTPDWTEEDVKFVIKKLKKKKS